MPKNKTDTPPKSSLVTQFLDLNENHDRKQSEQKKKKINNQQRKKLDSIELYKFNKSTSHLRGFRKAQA